MTVSPADSAQAVAVVVGFLSASFPWLPEAVATYVGTLAASLPIIPAILAWEVVGKALNKASPWIKATIGDRIAGYSFIINPLLGFLVGHFGLHNGVLGIVAGGVYGIVNSAGRNLVKKDLHGLVDGSKFAATVGLLLALMLTPSLSQAGPVMAPVAKALKPMPISLLDSSRFGVGVGLTERWTSADVLSFRGVSPKLGAKLGVSWQYSNHLGVQANGWKPVGANAHGYQGELGVLFAL